MLYVKKGKKQLICHEKECGFKKDLPENGNEQS